MASPFKDNFNPSTVRALGERLREVAPGFDLDEFVQRACDGLGALELKDRIRQVAVALAETLPGAYDEQVSAAEAALGGGAVDGWLAWPVVEFAGLAGTADPERALTALGRLTRHASAEFAVRAYLEQVPDVTWRHVDAWVRSDDVHRRRLASEGTRPRLPWGRHVKALFEPGATVHVLEALRDDPEEYVRRSVANHVGDIAKDRPAEALELCRSWLAQPGEHTTKLVRHALRGMLRNGDPEALALTGFGGDVPVEVRDVAIGPDRVTVDDVLTLTATVHNPAADERTVLLQYAIAGPRRRKTYYLGSRVLAGNTSAAVSRQHRLRDTTTRLVEEGEHTVTFLVDGVVAASAQVHVKR